MVPFGFKCSNGENVLKTYALSKIPEYKVSAINLRPDAEAETDSSSGA
jgi:hypothetical protein